MNHLAQHQRDPHVRLSKAIVELAYRDIQSEQPVLQASAHRFFTGSKFTLWADMMHVDHGIVMEGYERVVADGLPVVDKRQLRYKRTKHAS